MAARDNRRMSVSRQQLQQAFDALLQPERFKDYGPNGLQVEGKPDIACLVSGVTASRALIEAAIARRADATTVRLPNIVLRVANVDAVTVGSRVIGLVTIGPTRIVWVAESS